MAGTCVFAVAEGLVETGTEVGAAGIGLVEAGADAFAGCEWIGTAGTDVPGFPNRSGKAAAAVNGMAKGLAVAADFAL